MSILSGRIKKRFQNICDEDGEVICFVLETKEQDYTIVIGPDHKQYKYANTFSNRDHVYLEDPELIEEEGETPTLGVSKYSSVCKTLPLNSLYHQERVTW